MNGSDARAAGEDRAWWRRQTRARAATPPAPGDRPRVAFLPAGSHRAGSYRLRGWLVAEALRDLGWDSLVIPPSFDADRRARHLRGFAPRVVVMMRALHGLNEPGRVRAMLPDPSAPIVFDLDDADYVRDADRAATEAACRGSDAAIAGSRAVAQWCRGLGTPARVVWTGTPPPAPAVLARRPPNAQRGPVVAWGLTSYSRYGHEFAAARRLLAALAERGPVTLHLYGMRSPRKYRAELGELKRAGVRLRVFPLLDLARFERSLARAAVGLQIISPDNPYGEGKSFGKVLAYLAAGCVVAASDAADHGLFFDHGRNGVLARTDAQWVEAVHGLLADPARRATIQAAGYRDFTQRLTTHAAAELVDRHLRAWTAEPRPRRTAR